MDTRKNIIRVFFLTLLLFVMNTSGGFAQCPPPTLPLNQSTEIPGEFFDEQVLYGCDPYCPGGNLDYCAKGGVGRGSPGSSGSSITTDVSKARMDCPPTKKQDNTCEVEYPACTARPGGRTHFGEDSVCDKGIGLPTVGLNGILPGLFPGFLDNFTDCLSNFVSGLNFSSVGGFVGSFANSVTINGDVNAGRDGVCLGGSIGFCGFTAAGEACTLDEFGNAIAQAQAGVSFIEAYAPGIIELGSDVRDLQGPLILVDGGYLEGFGEIEPGEIVTSYMHAGQMAVYVFEAGTAMEDIYNGTAQGVRALDTFYADTTEYGLELYGLTRLPTEIIMQNAPDDSLRTAQAASSMILYGPSGTPVTPEMAEAANAFLESLAENTPAENAPADNAPAADTAP